jgi:hypothetical protein
MLSRRLLFMTLAALAYAGVAVPALGQSRPPSAHLRGEIASLQGDVLTLRAAAGETKVTLAPNASIRTVRKATVADLTPGTFIGIATVPQADGTLRAIEVHITPKGEKGPPEGSGPWDLAPKSTMTNAAVAHIESATISGVENRTVTLSYQGTQKQVLVPADIPIVMQGPGDRSLLVPGAHVVLFGQVGPDGFAARSVVVGTNGVNPPM